MLESRKEGFSGDGLELMAGLTVRKILETTFGLWLAQGEFTTVSNCCQLAQTAISAPLVCPSCKKCKYHKAKNTDSTPQYAGLTRVVKWETLNPQHTQQRYVKHRETFS